MAGGSYRFQAVRRDVRAPGMRPEKAHLLGIEADEVINLFGVAMRSGMRATELRDMLYAYPTRGSDVPYMP
jgi:hypothetical protein